LATVNSNVGSFGSATVVPVITVNGKGLITAVSTATITGSGGVTITNDIASATAHYPTMTTATTGTITGETVSSTKLSFIPSTGLLTATQFAGSAAGLTGVPAANLTGTVPDASLNGTYSGITLASPVFDTAVTGTALATQAQAEAGTAANKLMTPLQTAQAIAATPITRAATVASTSGTSITFTGIPSTARRIVMLFHNVSTTGTSNYIVRVGTSSGAVASGYNGGYASFTASANVDVQSSTGMTVYDCNAATDSIVGFCTWNQVSSLVWVGNSTVHANVARSTIAGSGVNPSAVVDRVILTTATGTDTFDNGTVTIMWE
jgi:hypothetical protein